MNEKVIMHTDIQRLARKSRVYDICVAMVRYTFVQSCHKKSFDPLQLWLDDPESRAGKIKMRRWLCEVPRESFVCWSDPDEEWVPARIRYPTTSHTVLNIRVCLRPFPLFHIHHPWLPSHDPQTFVFREGTNGQSIHRIQDYSSGSTCVNLDCYQPFNACHLVTTFLEKFKPSPNQEGVHNFVKAFLHADAMARSVWQPEVGTTVCNACTDMGFLTKARQTYSQMFFMFSLLSFLCFFLFGNKQCT